ncbi:Hermansky-Pudlak syndrome 4 protein [Gryllus bimaculatus]|nr:Hermansky-Pudlak syndrome 4 protein [Gryllus bimaculatus]
MAKELFIMFIYDTQRCQKEDDDPQDAVLYFHPTWVSDQQKLALCGQLMGATQFFLSAFSCPRVISLNSGKFVVQQFGQYILTVGTDRNIPDWILQHRADTLHSLLQFYHKDFDSISSKCAEDECR